MTHAALQPVSSAAIMETVTSSIYDKRRQTVERAIDLRESAEMHRRIFRAIRARKPEEARRLMAQHLKIAQEAQGMECPSIKAGHPIHEEAVPPAARATKA
jgi:GntR family transcriptional repressor for pyruvate dehydrogenase complex